MIGLPLFGVLAASAFKLSTAGYFVDQGVNVMAYDDIYPEGHQGGVALIMHANRVATNGDIRLEHTPGQWQAVPVQYDRFVDLENGTIKALLGFPDKGRHMTGFNPMLYPDIEFNYTVTVQADGSSFLITVDLYGVIPEWAIGKVGFNFEIFPGSVFGKPFLMDGKPGIYPRQAGGPTQKVESVVDHLGGWNPSGLANLSQLLFPPDEYNPMKGDDIIGKPLAVGTKFASRVDDPYSKFIVESVTPGVTLELYDGRVNHNNGWFVLRSAIPAGGGTAAVQWRLTPNVVDGWVYKPVVQASQLGYHPKQPKVAVLETDRVATIGPKVVELVRLTEGEEVVALQALPTGWGQFLRYNYSLFDFSNITTPGLYYVRYDESRSSVFVIDENVYDYSWRAGLEVFLPHQMCHMEVREKYRIWHGACHMDDALMAPTSFNHIDGYEQGPSTLVRFAPNEHIEGVAEGGWHDAGDYDLRVESQAGEAAFLAWAFEEFNETWDETSINWNTHKVEVHEPDGVPDLVQQVRHGALTVVGAWKATGRLYRGIIVPTLRQYVLLGEAGVHTDGKVGTFDDRWLFTEENPAQELETAGQLAAISRAMRGYYPQDAAEALNVSKALFATTNADNAALPKIGAAVELLLATGASDGGEYISYLEANAALIMQSIKEIGWSVTRVIKYLSSNFTADFNEALLQVYADFEMKKDATPYHIAYEPYIWGHAWDADVLACKYYWLYKYNATLFPVDYLYDTLNFVLGVHPGLNPASFVAGVGAVSSIPQYTNNRADWSYVPGGVVSGTALIRPDFPELLAWPFLWQQTEVVMNTGSGAYMFLALAVSRLVKA